MSQGPDIAELRRQFKQDKQALLASFLQQKASVTAAQRLMRQLARQVDATLQALWAQAGLPAGTGLVAVGGYGRGALFPHSDVDVLLLLPDGMEAHQPGALKSALESFITACWDVGLEIGS